MENKVKTISNSFQGLGAMFQIQRGLSKAQAIPVIGLAFSFVKGALSIAQIIVGIAATILLGTLANVFNSEYLAKKCFVALLHVGLGAVSLGYSLANICTFTVAGYRIENLTEKLAAKNA